MNSRYTNFPTNSLCSKRVYIVQGSERYNVFVLFKKMLHSIYFRVLPKQGYFGDTNEIIQFDDLE